MSLELAIRLTEMAMAVAFLIQSVEHIGLSAQQKRLFLPRFVLSLFLLAGIETPLICLALCAHSIMLLKHFNGPYNGGSDRLGVLMICCVSALHFLPEGRWAEYVFSYLALQLILSYFMAGWAKITHRAWWDGQALRDVFHFSAYPASEGLRGWKAHPTLLCAMGWAVMLFELLFPLALLSQPALIGAMVIGASFHLANACLFGFNRFFWIWLAGYPSLFWLQAALA